jgi:glucose/arabinose dehydrogenase
MKDQSLGTNPMRRRLRTLLVELAVLLAVAVAGPWATAGARDFSPLLLGNDPRIDVGALRVTVFADRLFFPMGMTPLPDGSLLVATSVPTGGGYFSSTGELRRLIDEDGDGVADDAGTVLAADLPGTLVAVARGGTLLFVTSAESGRESISVLRRGRSWSDPLTRVGRIDFHFDQFEHQTYGLAVRPYGADDHRYELFFNVGASGNDAAGRTVDVSGLVTATLDDAALYRVVVEDTGGTPAVSSPELIATGLRNAAAFAFDPATGDLLIADNGIDTPDNPLEALSADEIDRIPAADIGGEPEDFGFPESYVAYRSGKVIGDRGIAPTIAFQPIAGAESEGAASIAVAPPRFPRGLNAGVFVGFHGQWDETGIANEENPLLYADLATGETFALVSDDDPTVGHIDNLVATGGELFAADLCGGSGASMVGTVPCGTIYEIRARESAGDGTG